MLPVADVCIIYQKFSLDIGFYSNVIFIKSSNSSVGDGAADAVFDSFSSSELSISLPEVAVAVVLILEAALNRSNKGVSCLIDQFCYPRQHHSINKHCCTNDDYYDNQALQQQQKE